MVLISSLKERIKWRDLMSKNKAIGTGIAIEPATINDLKYIGKIVKGFLHPIFGETIRAKNGIVERVDGNGGKRIVLNGKIFPGNIYITGIKFKPT